MTLPARKSRPVRVEGIDLRWALSTTHQGDDTCVLNVTMQHRGGRGAKLIARGRCAVDSIFLDPVMIILPGHVAAIAKHALAGGWDPTHGGSDFVIDDFMPLVRTNL